MFKNNSRPFSLNKIFYTFNLFFIGIAPAVQFKARRVFWDAPSLNDYDYITLNLVFFVILVLYSVLYFRFLKIKKPKLLNLIYLSKSKKQQRKKVQLRFILFSISILSFFLFFYSKGFNLLAMLVRGGVEVENSLSLNTAFSLILNVFIRPIPVIALLYYKFSKKKIDWFEILMILIVLISNAPTSMPRFQAAALYIPLAIVYIKPLRRGYNFIISLTAGLLYVFPLLNFFRRYNEENTIKLRDNIFLSPDFDSYHNFAQLLNYDLVTYGRQLLGVFLFYFPRSIWEDKPIGSGHLLAEKLDLSLSNIAMNFFAEGYINFGYLGILIFIIFIAYFNSYWDELFYKKNRTLIDISFLFLLGMEFFILRGDLLSSFAYTVGITFAALCIYKLITIKKRKINS